MVIGGVWFSSENRSKFKQALKEIKEKNRYFSEIKWAKVSTSKLDFYFAILDYFFKQRDDIRFRCIAVDKSKVDLFKYHQSDADLRFYKF